MKELTLVYDNLGHKELEEYLLTVKGIKEVSIKNDNKLEINVKYDPKETSIKVIQTEIELFLDITKYSFMYSFDKHEKNTKTYHGTKDAVCCDYCYMGFIDELYNTEGVSKVSSNFEEYFSNHKIQFDVAIEYDPNKVTEEELKKHIEEL